MVARTLQKLSSQAVYVAKEGIAYAPWAGPGAVLAGWMVWPGLTENFKQETLGLKPATPVAVAPAAKSGGNFRAGGKYKYVKSEIGERPTLEED
uniref:Uncharacterized protein n=1 Tax=Globisporangium ultimum (strain ATCC 200006 / CBS 805.95 / DAOM BR144) TaxID=431595 RepID=K3WAF0_GLOUD